MQQPFAASAALPSGNNGAYPQTGHDVYAGHHIMPQMGHDGLGHDGQGRGVQMVPSHMSFRPAQMIRPDEVQVSQVEGGHNGSVLHDVLTPPLPATNGFFATLMRTGTVMFAPTTSGIGMMGSAPTSYTCGLKWHSVGDARPTGGRELTSHQLADALLTKTEFVQEELDSWGLTDLREDDFVASGKSYFTPVPGMNLCYTAMRIHMHAFYSTGEMRLLTVLQLQMSISWFSRASSLAE